MSLGNEEPSQTPPRGTAGATSPWGPGPSACLVSRSPRTAPFLPGFWIKRLLPGLALQSLSLTPFGLWAGPGPALAVGQRLATGSFLCVRNLNKPRRN